MKRIPATGSAVPSPARFTVREPTRTLTQLGGAPSESRYVTANVIVVAGVPLVGETEGEKRRVVAPAAGATRATRRAAATRIGTTRSTFRWTRSVRTSNAAQPRTDRSTRVPGNGPSIAPARADLNGTGVIPGHDQRCPSKHSAARAPGVLPRRGAPSHRNVGSGRIPRRGHRPAVRDPPPCVHAGRDPGFRAHPFQPAGRRSCRGGPADPRGGLLAGRSPACRRGWSSARPSWRG